MNITENQDALTVENRSVGLSRLCTALSVALFAWGIYCYLTEYSGLEWKDKFIGSMAGGMITAVMAMLLFEHGVFTFNGKGRVIRWRRKWLFRLRQGEIPFQEVKAVVIEVAIGSNRVNPSRRIAIVAEHETVPLTASYQPDLGEYEKVAERLNGYLGNASRDVLMESIRAAVQAGRKTEAVQLLRQQRNISMEEAKGIIDCL